MKMKQKTLYKVELSTKSGMNESLNFFASDFIDALKKVNEIVKHLSDEYKRQYIVVSVGEYELITLMEVEQ